MNDIEVKIYLLQALEALRVFFLNCAVGLWVLRPLLAYCASPG
jgi:hypothetical protein